MVNVQFSFPSNRGIGSGAEWYPYLASRGVVVDGGNATLAVYNLDPRCCRGRCETLLISGWLTTVIVGFLAGGIFGVAEDLAPW